LKLRKEEPLNKGEKNQETKGNEEVLTVLALILWVLLIRWRLRCRYWAGGLRVTAFSEPEIFSPAFAYTYTL